MSTERIKEALEAESCTMSEYNYSLSFNLTLGMTVEQCYKNHEQIVQIGEHRGLSLDKLNSIIEVIPDDIRYQFVVFTHYNDDLLDHCLLCEFKNRTKRTKTCCNPRTPSAAGNPRKGTQ